MTARAVARLLPKRAETKGTIRFEGIDVLAAEGRRLRALRDDIGIIFQDPRAHVNPVRRIGDFMTEALRTNHGVTNDEAQRRSRRNCWPRSASPDGERRLRQYPHELSGGLLQRVMIATALLTEPTLLLADEPTTALDVTTQAEVMAILDDLRRERGLALLFITHDLDLAGAVCDRTVVMYAGQVVEQQPSATPARPRAPSLHGGARRRPSRRVVDRAAVDGDPRPTAVGVRGAAGLRLRTAVPARDRRLPGRTAGAARPRRRVGAMHQGRRARPWLSRCSV